MGHPVFTYVTTYLQHEVLVDGDLVRQVHVGQPLGRVHHVPQGHLGLLAACPLRLQVVEAGDEEAAAGAGRVGRARVGAARAPPLLPLHLDGGRRGGRGGAGGGGRCRSSEMEKICCWSMITFHIIKYYNNINNE